MSLKNSHRRPVPDWLARLDLTEPDALSHQRFDHRQICERALYYPAADVDGRPVQFLGGFVHSFIYVDYGAHESTIDAAIEATGFCGYRVVGRRKIRKSELPSIQKVPKLPTRYQREISRAPKGYEMFVTWYVLERDRLLGEDHGPWRFSLLYICGDGIATYQALYSSVGKAPEILAIIQPGHACGGNYTDFTNPDGAFAWVVLQEHPRTIPEYLLHGGRGTYYTHACWPKAYPHHIEWLQVANGNGVWRRQPGRSSS